MIDSNDLTGVRVQMPITPFLLQKPKKKLAFVGKISVDGQILLPRAMPVGGASGFTAVSHQGAAESLHSSKIKTLPVFC